MPQIEGLRFIAVLSVVVGHWVSLDFSNNFVFSNIPYSAAVNLFFVISGFLITSILLNKKEEIHEGKISFLKAIKNFYIKRILRIFPIYYLLIAILCILSYNSIKEYIVYLLTYTLNWFMVAKSTYTGNVTHLWSLAIEEQFYLIWPFLIFIVPKRWILGTIIIFILIGILSKIYFAYYIHYLMGVNAATTSCFDSLGFGALIAYIQRKRTQPFRPRLYKTYLLISILIYILLFIDPGFLNPELRGIFPNFGNSVVFFFIVTIAANNGFSRVIKSFLENNVVLYLGSISYGIYLYQAYATNVYFNTGFNKYFPNMKGDADLFIMLFLIAIIMASASWYLIERPILSLKKYFQ